MKLGWCVMLILVGGCKKKEEAPASPPSGSAAVGSGSGVDSGSGSDADSGSGSAESQAGGVPALPGKGDRAYVSGSDGLVEVSEEGAAQVVPGVIRWCNVDARGKVVWFTTDEGLRAFDLEDRRVRPIITANIDDVEVIINWGNQQLGGEDKVAFHAGVELAMTGPALAKKVGCDGDAVHHCYEEGDETKPTDELAAALKRVEAMKLVDPAYITSVAKRGATRSLWAPPPPPPKAPKPPKISKKACEEEPGDCGKLTVIPGSALWLVTTGNSRGDFYHETRELFDPATGEFVSLVDGALVRSKQPRGEGVELTNLRIGSGGTMTQGGAVFSPTQIFYQEKGEGEPRSCGWASGGWRVPGIRD